uniref:Putative effector protein n=1 Tax=Heterodera avenae TaxID=34510 RepID=A0A2L0VDJ5_HETAV|nr:putative effector protein [Heterodera avenae]
MRAHRLLFVVFLCASICCFQEVISFPPGLDDTNVGPKSSALVGVGQSQIADIGGAGSSAGQIFNSPPNGPANTDPKIAPQALQENPCKNAPTKALRLYCNQLYRWDQSARFAPSNQEAVTLNPSIPNVDLLAADLAPNAGASANAPGGVKLDGNFNGGPPPIPETAALPPPPRVTNTNNGFREVPQASIASPTSSQIVPPSTGAGGGDGDADVQQAPAGPPPPAKGRISNADPCAEAPTRALRFVCKKLIKWDKNARAAPQVDTAIPKMPSIAGLPTPDILAGDLAPIAATPYQCMDMGCLCRYLGGNGQEGSNFCQMPNGQPLRKALRKEYRMMTDQERIRYHTALKAIKQSGEYDNLSRIHSNPTIVGGAHSGPAFLPWHREYVKRMEIALRQVDPSISIPYWDSTLEAQLPTPSDSHLFTEEFMGRTDDQGNLVYGDFAGWRTTEGNPNIRRRVGLDGKGFTEDEINWFLSQQQIDQILAYSAPQPGVCPVRMEFRWMEITHGNVHLFVGGATQLPNGTDEADGDMAEQTRSANDPIFFLHHSFVDYIWEMWRVSKQTRQSRERDYPMDNAQCSSAQHFGSAPMRPFEPWQNRDGLKNNYTDSMYEYAPRPSCQMGPNCGSKFLFCDNSHGQPHCAAKVRTGGNCTGFNNGEDVCHNGICRNGRCVKTTTDTSSTPWPMPPTDVTTAKPIRPVQSCYNEHECCSVWSQKGECQRNPSFMNSWCKTSCQQCQPDYDSNQECDDRHPNCQSWTSQGMCQRNKFWMAENCRQSCGKCRISRQHVCGGGSGSQENGDRITLAPPANRCSSPSCYNENICCQLWGLAGECHRNPTWMSCFCKVSCGRCIPQDYDFGGCADYHQRCRLWANSGQCQRNAWMLENCRWSCGTCVSFWELRQLCRMGNARLKRETVEGMPAIDFDNIGTSMISRFERAMKFNLTKQNGYASKLPVHGIENFSTTIQSSGPPSDNF